MLPLYVLHVTLNDIVNDSSNKFREEMVPVDCRSNRILASFGVIRDCH